MGNARSANAQRVWSTALQVAGLLCAVAALLALSTELGRLPLGKGLLSQLTNARATGSILPAGRSYQTLEPVLESQLDNAPRSAAAGRTASGPLVPQQPTPLVARSISLRARRGGAEAAPTLRAAPSAPARGSAPKEPANRVQHGGILVAVQLPSPPSAPSAPAETAAARARVGTAAAAVGAATSRPQPGAEGDGPVSATLSVQRPAATALRGLASDNRSSRLVEPARQAREPPRALLPASGLSLAASTARQAVVMVDRADEAAQHGAPAAAPSYDSASTQQGAPADGVSSGDAVAIHSGGVDGSAANADAAVDENLALAAADVASAKSSAGGAGLLGRRSSAPDAHLDQRNHGPMGGGALAAAMLSAAPASALRSGRGRALSQAHDLWTPSNGPSQALSVARDPSSEKQPLASAGGLVARFDNDTTLHELYGDAFDPAVSVGDDEIIVLGMHNSGTSITTRLVMLMGAYGGNLSDLWIGETNKLKYYERYDVNKLHVRFLNTLGDPIYQGWHAQNFSLLNGNANTVGWLRHGAQALLQDLRAHPPLVLKDPKMCLALDVWMPLMRSPHCVIVTADPARIAAHLTLSHRKKWTHQQGLKMTPERFMVTWEATIFHAVRGCIGIPTVLPVADGLNSDTIAAYVQSLHRSLSSAGVRGLTLPSDSELAAKVTKYFISSGHVRGPEPAPAQMTARQRALHDALEYYARNATAGAQAPPPTLVAGLIMAKARRDMGEPLWEALNQQYPRLDESLRAP